MDERVRRLQAEATAAPASDRIGQGTLISRAQYLVDIGPWGDGEARLEPGIRMSAEDVARWARAIDTKRTR